VTLGDRGIKEGAVEYQHRRDSASQSISLADIAAHVKAQLLV
jgi:prolyl-tRNA synthetase